MKWPETVTLIRHDESVYNRMKKERQQDPLYLEFQKQFDRNPESVTTYGLARQIWEKYSVQTGDHDTPLAENAGWQTQKMAAQLHTKIVIPDVIFVSPYLRAEMTLEHMKQSWPELRDVQTIEEHRIREQDYGLVLLYNDWRVFCVFYPEQRLLRQLQGSYWYRLPQGENVPDIRDRMHSWNGTLSRDWGKKNVLAISHHLAILSYRANQERFGEEEFLRLDREEKPVNSGVTIYKGDPHLGKDGRLVLDIYNAKLY